MFDFWRMQSARVEEIPRGAACLDTDCHSASVGGLQPRQRAKASTSKGFLSDSSTINQHRF